MKKVLLIFVLLFCSATFSQVNTELIGSLNPQSSAGYNDIWGYVDENKNEYAILGCRNGISIINLIDPANPEEVVFFPGTLTAWRDIKVHDKYAYVVSDQTNEGLIIIDLSQLPTTATIVNTVHTWFSRAHNIFIDNGFAYAIGTENGGGMHILDLTNPTNPTRTAYYTASGYIHDVYVWNDTVVACAEDSYDLVDVSDKSNPIMISESAELPGIYAHAGWMTEDKRYFLGTEEFNVRDITVWDLQDRTSWELVNPKWELSGTSRVHNLFVKGNYAYVSYYADGLVILDISNPASPVYAGQYDSYPGNSGGFPGAWGAYPYLPSGNILISDTETGLYVVKFTPQNVAPSINHQSFSEVLNNDQVEINASIADDNSVTNVALFYRTIYSNQTSNWIELTPTSGPSEINNYNFVIPGHAHLITVEYYLGAVDNTGLVATLPSGGSGTNPPGSNPPANYFSYDVVIAGTPVLYSYTPTSDTTINKNGSVNFILNVEDTSNLDLSYTWYKNGIAVSTEAVYQYNSLSFLPAPRTDSIRVEITNGYKSVEKSWNINVLNQTTGTGSGSKPLVYKLNQNYPNPFNPSTQIKFSIPKEEFVTLSVYNLIGEKVADIVNRKLGAGEYSFEFDASNFTSGIYIAEIKAGNYRDLIKMTLLK